MLTQKQLQNFLDETQGERVMICCDDHGYYPGSKTTLPPALGCKYCVWADLYYEFSKISPDKREEMSVQLEALVHHLAEGLDKGQWDINLFERPQVTIEKDVDEKKIILTDDAS